jgi:hypothetical protein
MPFHKWSEIKNRKKTPMSDEDPTPDDLRLAEQIMDDVDGSNQAGLKRAAERIREYRKLVNLRMLLDQGEASPIAPPGTFERVMKRLKDAPRLEDALGGVHDLSHVGAEIHEKWRREELAEVRARWLRGEQHKPTDYAVMAQSMIDVEDQATHDRHDRDRFLAILGKVREWNERFKAEPHTNTWAELDALLTRAGYEAGLEVIRDWYFAVEPTPTREQWQELKDLLWKKGEYPR